MAAHRRPRQRATGTGAARTAVALTLAGAATAAGLGAGTGHAAPEPAPAQAGATVDRLYREAEAATEKYNGAKERADSAERRLERLRDEVARREDRLNTARETLGSAAAAQYRGGGLGPALRLALSSDPDRYLDGAALVQRVGTRQKAAVGAARAQLREIEQLRGAARIELAALTSRRAELERHRDTITARLAAARRLQARLDAERRARLGPGPASPSPASAASADGRALPAPSGLPGAPGPRAGAPGSAPRTPGDPAPGSRAAAAVAYAHQKLGSPYVWGAAGPHAFDCSGLTQAAYRAAGVSLPRTTYAQIGAGQRVPRSQLRPGDLVFFYPGVTHVGIYVGGGRMIHAPNPSAPVRLAPIDEMPFAGATRVT
ncbi:C40 family peptidase [Streptomyces sp. SHP 1-2]|uniref:C40 family peptidase n=1 Tax=Streptomyces sp. SHP 1-2 TaxID=2769489 RepID=UPI0022379DF0|nr:C40 family peptidase [Streptomyces sp. SHP 1-2]MCW5251566.1 C40 family peptidase [Streptomyces sp. SHP 1-2]